MNNLAQGLAAATALVVMVMPAYARPYRQQYPLPSPGVPQSLGVNIHFTTPNPGETKQLASEGFKWIRTDFSWSVTEQSRGVYNFTAYDTLMSHLKRYGIRPIFIFDYGNDLYQNGSPTTPKAIAAFCRWVTAAVDHFKREGILWEMWNEPNIGFWKPVPNVQQYIALAQSVGSAIRAAQPQEWFIGPGVSGMDLTFIRACLTAGLLKFWDAVSFHPYRDTAPETAASDFQSVEALIHQFAPNSKPVPILASEWGYSELYPGLNINRQARLAVREFLSNMSSGLRLTIWYDWHDDGTDAQNAEDRFGTVTYDYQPKPIFNAIHTLATTLNGYVYTKRLAVGGPNDWCLLFRNRKGDDALAFWRVAGSAAPLDLPLISRQAVLVSMLGTRSDARDAEQAVFTREPQYMMLGRHARLEPIAANDKGK